MIDPTSAWGSVKAALQLNAWRAGAIAIAGAIVYWLQGRDLLPFEIPDWAFWIIYTIAGLCAAIALGDLVQAIFKGISWLGGLIISRWSNWQTRKRILRRLDTLGEREKQILGYLLARNEQSFDGAIDGGYAQPLFAKKLITRPGQIGNPFHCVYMVPDFIWAELKKRKRDFPDTYQGNSVPWRRPWA